jgi:hypothetical protein
MTKIQKLVSARPPHGHGPRNSPRNIGERYNLQPTGLLFSNSRQAGCRQVQAQPCEPRRPVHLRHQGEGLRRGPRLIYTMPMSAGDVFLSTSVVKALRQSAILATWCTSPPLPSTFRLQVLPFDEVIEWQPWMQDISVLEDIFDEVYTPNLAVQMAWSNWVHRGQRP